LILYCKFSRLLFFVEQTAKYLSVYHYIYKEYTCI